MEKVEKECPYRGIVQLTVVRMESWNHHEDRTRREMVLEGIRGKQERDDHTRTKVWMFEVVYQTMFHCRFQCSILYVIY